MSNLSNLMISGSYLGLINLQDSTQNLASQTGDIELQDGTGANIGLTINAQTKEFTVVNNFKVDGDSDFNGNVDISGSLTHTGSIDIIGDLNVTGDITAETGSFDTLHTRVLHVTTETASVIFSSGSNKLGDEESDRQDLVGQVIVSGTLGVEGDSAFTGSLTVSNEISSSTINGIGNVTSYSASVDSRLDDLEFFSSSEYQTDSASFDNRIDQLESDTGSQDSRLDNLEAFTGSQETINGFYNQHTSSLNAFSASQLNINGGYNTFTSSYYIDSASFDLRLDQQEAFSSSLVQDFVSTPDFNSYTSSTDNRLNNIELETSSIDNRLDNIELTTSSLQVEIDGLSSFTGSYATTGSNIFDGSQQITGSVNGNVETLTITSLTASIDCSLGNFFTITLPSGSTQLQASNIIPGQTISVKVNLDSNTTNLTTNDTILFPSTNVYIPTQNSGSKDLLSFVSFDSNELLGASILRLQ
jgi:cytoskeletal protein CcmA (bactofilin family)